MSRLRRPSFRPIPVPDAPADAVDGSVGAAPPSSSSRFGHLWHLLWVVPLVGSVIILAAPPDRFGPAPQILAFEVQPAAARPGAAITLTWSVEGAERVRIDPLPGRDVPAVGRQTLPAPAGSTTFQLTASGRGQTRTANVALKVAQAPPAVVLFEAQPEEIAVGEAAMLAWNVSGDDVAVTIEPGDGTLLGANGSILLYPTVSTVYTLIARNAVGEASAVAKVQVGGLPLPSAPQIRRFEVVATKDPTGTPASGAGVDAAGGMIVLGWSVTGAEEVELGGEASASGLPSEGSVEVAAPAWTTIYRLTARGPGGTTIAELPVQGTGDDAPAPLPTPPVVVRPILSGDPGVAAPPPDGGNSGNLVDSVVAQQGGDAYAQFAPVVETFEVSPAHARLGDEVVVRWVVSGAEAVAVRFDPTTPGTAPLTAHAGIHRFVATNDVSIVLEATNVVGSIVRRQVTFAVRTFAPEATGLDVRYSAPQLLVAGERGTGTALVTERGSVWLFRDGNWRFAGALPLASGPPLSAAFVGQTLFVAGADGMLQTLDVSGVGPPALRLDPWRAIIASGAVDLSAACPRLVGVAGFSTIESLSGADQGGTLVVACAEPEVVLAIAVGPGGQVASSPRWQHQLEAAPSAIVGTPRPGTGDGTIAVRYPSAGQFAYRVDILAASVGWIGTVTSPRPVTAAAPGPDGNVVVAAVAGQAAVYVLDRRGLAARRIDLPAEVATLTWQAAVGWRLEGAETPRLAPLVAQATPLAGVPGPRSEAEAPTPVPAAGDANAAATQASPGWLLLTWANASGGALVNLAPWSDTPIVARLLPDRPLLALVDDGNAIVGAARSPSRASAFSWLSAGDAARRGTRGGGP